MTTAIIGTGGIGSAIARRLASGGDVLQLSRHRHRGGRRLGDGNSRFPFSHRCKLRDSMKGVLTVAKEPERVWLLDVIGVRAFEGEITFRKLSRLLARRFLTAHGRFPGEDTRGGEAGGRGIRLLRDGHHQPKASIAADLGSAHILRGHHLDRQFPAWNRETFPGMKPQTR